MEDKIDIDDHDYLYEHLVRHALEVVKCDCRKFTIDDLYDYVMSGLPRDRFYYLAQLNRADYDNIPRNLLIKKIKILTEAYTSLFDPSLPFSSHNVHICRFFFESASRIGAFRDMLMEYCSGLAESTVIDRQHLIDVLPRCDLKDKILKSLQSIDIAPRLATESLYHDTQSAHAVKIVTEDGNPLIDRSSEFEAFVAKLPDTLRKMEVIDKIRIDNSEYNLCSVFVHVIDTINNLPGVKTEVMQRLAEELKEMTDTCATGMRVRLVNVLSGYTTTIRIALPFEAELNAAFFARFNKKLSEASVALRNMYSESITERMKRGEYILFKETVCSELYDELQKEYKTMPGYDSRLFTTAFASARAQV